MQSDRDADRIVALGADAQIVRRTGNIKFDQPAPDSAGIASLRATLGLTEQEQLVVAGSTHPGEEEALVDSYRLRITSYNVCYTKLLRELEGEGITICESTFGLEGILAEEGVLTSSYNFV